MFNILLLVAGILLYILLGVQYKVWEPRYTAPSGLELRPNIAGQLPKYLPGRHFDRSCFPQRRNRLLPDPEIRGDSGFVLGHDTSHMSCRQRREAVVPPCISVGQGRRRSSGKCRVFYELYSFTN